MIIEANFNPRSPSGLRPGSGPISLTSLPDFNPRSPSGLRHAAGKRHTDGVTISIHAARVGCDQAGL